MKVLIVSTSESTGGGAIAAMRLKDALNKHGVCAKMLVRDRQTDSDTVTQTGNILPKAFERLAIMPWCGLSLQRSWLVDTAWLGVDITGTRDFRDADVIHLHWVNQGMLSLSELERILHCGKRVVWTLHDEWPFRGVCHYSGNCTSVGCQTCPLMRGCLPASILARKMRLYASHRITFVGCSQWMADLARRAMPNADVRCAPNCIPHDIFKPIPRLEARDRIGLPQDRQVIMFCSQRLDDKRKGMDYLDKALGHFPQAIALRVGKGGRQTCDPREMAALYSAADVFVSPSLQDNLPNTIAEAMSCGTPCVGFDTGGIPEMIRHMHTGYVARTCDAADLAKGINHVLAHDMRQAAYQYAAATYDETSVAEQYISIYESR